jgi:hypothetical protein
MLLILESNILFDSFSQTALLANTKIAQLPIFEK